MRKRAVAGACVLAAMLSGLAAADPQPSLPAWSTWPTGRLFPDDPRPTSEDPSLRLCSLELPVCIHAPRGTSDAELLSTLTEAESSLRALHDRALLPWPEADRGGGSPALDLYLEDGLDRSVRVGLELPTSEPVDRDAAFVRVSRKATGCARRAAIARGIATSMLAAVDGGACGGTLASIAGYLAATTTGCWGELLAPIDEAQAHPERASIHPSDVDDPDASPLLPWYLDEGFGSGAPGALLTALVYAERQPTPRDATRFVNQPDFFSVLTKLAKGREKKLDDVLLDYAIARAFVGDRDDGQHLAETSWLGRAGRVRFESSWTWGSLPRRLAFTPLEPTGSTYLWVDLADAPKGAAIAMHLEWEEPVTMRWAAVRVGMDGQEVSRLVVTSQRGIRVAERSVAELDGLAGLIVVGVSAGEVGRDHPYRVDEAPYEPHGGTIYLAHDTP